MTITEIDGSGTPINVDDTKVIDVDYEGGGQDGLDDDDVDVSTTGDAECEIDVKVTAKGQARITLTECRGDGTVTVDVPSGGAPVPPIVVTVDNTRPTAAITRATGQATPTAVTPVLFTVVFSEAVEAASFTAADVIQASPSATWTVTDSGDHVTFTLSATGVSGGGTLAPALALDAVRDRAGNGSGAANAGASTVDFSTGIASVQGVTSDGGDGAFNTGDTMNIRVTFSENVTVSGVPELRLETGLTDRTIGYVGGSGTRILTFAYTVAGGDASADLNYHSIAALTLNGGSILTTANSSPASLTLPGLAAAGSLATNHAIVIDTTSPSVANVSASTADGHYDAGEAIDVTVSFSETVTVDTTGGTPRIQLETGATDRYANYTGGTGSSLLTFRYVVQAGDASADLDYLSTLAFGANGGTIRDAAGNPAGLVMPALAAPGPNGSLGGNKAIVVDTAAATVTNVGASVADGTYSASGVIDVTVTFSEPVRVTGAPRLQLETGATDRYATYLSGHDSSVLTFRYTVVSGDASADLEYVSTAALGLNGGTILDRAGNVAALALPALGAPGPNGSLGGNQAIVVNTGAVTVLTVTSTDPDGTYLAGSIIEVRVAFTGMVDVDLTGGQPRIQLETGSTDRYATYFLGDNSSFLIFRYTVQAGDVASDLDYVGIGAFTLNGGTINDLGGNPVALSLAAPGTLGSLGNVKDIVIDAAPPTVLNVSASTADGAYDAGDAIDVAVTFSEPPVFNTTGGTPRIELETGATNRYASYAGTVGSVATFRYTVVAGDASADLEYAATGSLGLNGGTIADVAGNPAVLTLPALGALGPNGSLAGNKAIVVDTVGSAVTGVTALTANGSYNAGDFIDVIVSFDEPVRVTTTGGTPRLLLETGATDRYANFLLGNDSTTPLFRYVVQAGDTSADLEYVSTAALELNGGNLRDLAGGIL